MPYISKNKRHISVSKYQVTAISGCVMRTYVFTYEPIGTEETCVACSFELPILWAFSRMPVRQYVKAFFKCVYAPWWN